MGRLPKNERHYEPEVLQARHREMLRRLAVGQDRQSIAKDLGISTATVTYTQHSALGQAQLALLQNGRDSAVIDISEQIQDLLPKAIKVMEGALNGYIEPHKNSNVTPGQKINVAKDILGRGGHVAPTRVQGQIEHNHKLTADDIAGIKERAGKVARINGTLANAEITDIEVIEPTRLEDGNAEGSDTHRSPTPNI